MGKRRIGGLTGAFLGITAGFVIGILLFQRNKGRGIGESDHVGFRMPFLKKRMSTWHGLQLSSTASVAIELSMQKIDEGSSELLHNKSLGESKLIFIGVMTAQKYLSTRAKAVYESWGQDARGSIVFYSSESSRQPRECPQLPLHALSRVDDTYPPQKKSFLMLQHMWFKYGESFEWFLRADDDLYVRMDRLESLLRSIDSRKPKYIGQAGRGNSEEFGLLSLEYNENFCMGGPGVLISRETLRRIVPHIKHCLANLYTAHEDVELGRCVRKFAGISCTWSYEMQSILYHNGSGGLAFTGKLKSKEVHRAISMHPVKNSTLMYRLHNYMKGLNLQGLQNKKLILNRYIEKHLVFTEFGTIKDQSSLAVKNFSIEILKKKKKQNCSVSSIENMWDYISSSLYSACDANPRRRLKLDLKEGLEDMVRDVMIWINTCSKQRGRLVEEKQILYGYRSQNIDGIETILDLLLVYKKYRGKKVTLPVRRHLYLHQHFSDLDIQKMKSDYTKNITSPIALKSTEAYNQENDIIHFILPVYGRSAALLNFIDNYEKICLKSFNNHRRTKKFQTKLIIVFFQKKKSNVHKEKNNLQDSEENGLFKSSIVAIERMKKTYGKDLIQLVEGHGKFSRARALHQGISFLHSKDLIFIVDVDIHLLSLNALQKIRKNTIRSKRIYFPVVFSQYNPKIVCKKKKGSFYLLCDHERSKYLKVDKTRGFWRLFGYGIVSIYKSDYNSIGKFNLNFEGWGREDVDLYEKAVKSNLQIFRAPDSDLVHIYHGITCDFMSNISYNQLSMCWGTRADTYASMQLSASLINRYPIFLQHAIFQVNNKN